MKHAIFFANFEDANWGVKIVPRHFDLSNIGNYNNETLAQLLAQQSLKQQILTFINFFIPTQTACVNMFLSWLLRTLPFLWNTSHSSTLLGNNDSIREEDFRPFVIVVEGNVGSGKSTFLDIVSSWPGVEVYQEPVESWRNVSGENLFEMMNKNPDRWMTTFQLYSTLTRWPASCISAFWW